MTASQTYTPPIFNPGFTTPNGTTLNNALANPQLSTQYGVIAKASGTQANSTPILAAYTQVDTVATAADGVLLPASWAGRIIKITNNASNAMQVFPQVSDTINGVTSATGISQAGNSTVEYNCSQAGKWFANTANSGEFNSLILNGATSGTTTVNATAIAGSTTLTLPAVTGTVASTTGTNLFIPDVKKCTAQTDTITTVLANITGLTAQTLVAGATYRFRCVLPGTADGTSGISYGFKYTTATLTSIEATSIGYIATATSAVQHTTTTTDQALLFDKAAVIIMTIIEGSMVVNAGGTVALQVGTHTGTTTASVYLGATMEFVRIA